MQGGDLVMEEMGTYTQYMFDNKNLAVSRQYDIDYDYSELLEMINSPDFFLPFSERLHRFLSQRQGKDYRQYSHRESYQYLFDRMKDAGISPNRNTLKKWLNVRENEEGDFGPKMGDEGRESMFQVAFSLGLNEEEAEDFFHRVYLDKAFNARNPKEFVYYYCILHGKPYAEAQALAEEAVRLLAGNSETGNTSATVMVKGAAKDAGGDNELLAYIQEHPFNFTKSSKTALAMQERLLGELRGGDGKEGLAEKEFNSVDRDDDISKQEGRNLHSTDFVLDMAVNGPDCIEKAVGGTGVKRAREILPRKEISNQFPNANTISHPDSSYILRKNIIFLYFYWYWVKDLLKAYPEGDDESFITELNSILYNCGFSPLYYGNPYDWVFLYCSGCKENKSWPLVVFREILEIEVDEE